RSSGQPSFSSVLALDLAGNICILWQSFDSNFLGTLFFSKSTDRGQTFSTPIAVTPSTQDAEVASMGLDKNGNILVTYSDISGFFNGDDPRLFAVRSTNGGASFSTPVPVSQTTQAVEGGYIAFDSKGAAYI